MPITREKTDLDKKPTWFLFLGANVVILLGCAITWIMISKGDINLDYLPTLICNIVAMVLAGLFAYFEIKDIAPKIMHFRRKWLNFYIASFIVFVAAILYNAIMFVFYIAKANPRDLNSQIWQLAIYLSITGVLTLVSIGLQRYARFRIDLDIYRRKHGENQAQKEAENKQKNDQKNDQKIEQKPAEKNDKKDPKNSAENKPKKSGATGGLLDQME